MTYNVDLMSGEKVERTLRSVEVVEVDSPADAIRTATMGTIGHDWPISGSVAQEPGGIRYWMATSAAQELDDAE